MRQKSTIGKLVERCELEQAVVDVLMNDSRVLFAYLYGSFLHEERFHDIDIAVYAEPGSPEFFLSSDLKVDLHKQVGFPPDFFDVRVINDVIAKGDLFALLFLKRLFETGKLLVDNNREVRTDYIEQYGRKYLECEGLISEVLV